MSHFTKIKTKIYDLEIFKKSLSDLNLEFTTENLEINGYNNQKTSADLIIKQKKQLRYWFQMERDRIPNGNRFNVLVARLFSR